MKKQGVLVMPRREFIASVPAFLIGGRLLDISESWPASGQKQGEVSEVLTPEELKIINRSVMAGDLLNYFKKGYNCAESFLYVALKFMKKPRKLFWVASGFGGGIGHKDLCGFLTGGVMAIGLSVGKLKVNREEAKEIWERKVDEYWKWWASLAPYRCSGIKTEGRTSEVCKRVGRLAAARIEGLIKGISPGS
ncbi:MAG: C-GCAxxG-C-C family protein [Candidatus Aminicenantes bacterium]|nr:C-GCAxxG-C-C family protein [Candidatus Aminicenantes bacterium]MDH5705990.1 C-GCAxxG-C-C family protein [Candidatus Aminicenantes bacterium]